MSVYIVNSTQTVRAGDRLQVTFSKSFWTPNGIFNTVWERMTGALYIYTASPAPIGADSTAVVDVVVTQAGNGKSLGQIGGDMARLMPIFGVDISGVKVLKASDLRSAVAPARRESAEKEQATKNAQANPINRFLSVFGNLGKGVVVVLVVVALIYFYNQRKKT